MSRVFDENLPDMNVGLLRRLRRIVAGPPHLGSLDVPRLSLRPRAEVLDLSPAADASGERLPYNPRERMQQEYEHLSATPAHDRNGRWRSMLANAFQNLSAQARAVTDASLRSGRPVDEYGLASVAGAGLGGGFAGAVNPKLDEARKREYKMREMEAGIGRQLQIERQLADLGLKTAQADYARRRPELDRAKREGVRLDKDRTRILSMWRALGRYDPTNPRHDPLTKEAERLGIDRGRAPTGPVGKSKL